MSDTGAPTRPALAVIDAGASPEEVAAIVAAVTAALGSAASGAGEDDALAPASGWVTAARLRTRGAGLQRGGWRWSDRLGGRVTT